MQFDITAISVDFEKFYSYLPTKALGSFFLQSGAEPIGALVEVDSVAGLGENEHLGVLVGIWDSAPLLVLVGSSSSATS